MQLKKLPVGLSSFKEIRESDYVYVDKTRQIWELVNSGKYFFLARPRRFGKSLLLDTLDHLFRGDKELFEGLYIYKDWKWEEKYPVIRLSMSRNAMTIEKLNNGLISMLTSIADDNEIELKSKEPDDLFTELIKALYRKTNQKAVILIDEYDKPILDELDAMRETDASRANKKVLNNFYSVIKDNPDYLHFVFLTGVTRFSGLSIFSGLNNLVDLTLDDKFADICGYTQKELEENFKPHIKALAEKENMSSESMLAKIKHWYDGYTWDGKTEMYNPFSTLYLFSREKFGMHWFASGPPNYLISYIKDVADVNLFFEKGEAAASDLMNFNPEETMATALLFQTGYLTIKGKKDKANDEPNYFMDSPNLEVRKSLAKHILLGYIGSTERQRIVGLDSQFLKSALDEDAKSFADTVSAVLTRIPYTINETKNENKDEGGESFYHAMLTCIMIAMDFNVASEYITNLGRIDIVWKYENKVFIIEMKFVNRNNKKQDEINKEIDEKIESALAQIKDKKYYEQYTLAKKEVILVGLAVSTKAQEVKAKFERL